MKDVLKRLTEADGIAGREEEVRKLIQTELASLPIRLEEDSFGNLSAHLENGMGRPKVMVAAHMDEVGFIVKYITPTGFIYVQPFGAWHPQVLIGQKVTITSRKNKKKYRGIFNTTLLNNKNLKEAELNDLYLDIGAVSRKNIEEMGIQIGDMVTPFADFEELGNDLVLAKALDDRIGCAILIESLKKLSQIKSLPFEVVGVFTVQEEVGTRGATVVAQKIKPTEALILDVATAKDTPGAATYQSRCLNEGPGIVWYDKTAVSAVEICDRLIAVASEHKITYQHDLFSGGGTDAGAIQLAGGGVLTAGISVGVRNCHSGSSLASLKDIKMASALLNAYLLTPQKERG